MSKHAGRFGSLTRICALILSGIGGPALVLLLSSFDVEARNFGSASAKTYFDRGLEWYRKGEPGRAIADFNIALTFDRGFADAYCSRALARLAQGEWDEALADLNKAIDIQPRFAEAYYNRGLTYQSKGELGNAVADYGRAIHLKPRLASAYLNRAGAYCQSGDLRAALVDLNRAIALNSHLAQAHNSRGVVQYLQGDLEKAMADFDRAIKLDGRIVETYVNRACLRVERGDLGGAVADVDKALSLAPTLAPAYFVRGNAWRDKGDPERAQADYTKAIEMDPRYSQGSYRVPAAGGQPTALTLSHDGRAFSYRPQFLPDGRRFLYFVEPDAVYLASLDGGEPNRILTNTSSMALYASGYLLFQRERTIVAQRFDDNLTNPLGDSVPIVQDVRRSSGPPDSGFAPPIGGALFSVSENGVLAYVKGLGTNVRLLLRWFDRAGQSLDTIPFPFKTFASARLSPDNTQIAMSSPAENSEIWLFHIAQGRLTQLTFSEGSDRRPIWSPDGRRLVFASLRKGAPGLYIKSAGGEKDEELVLRSGSAVRNEHWPVDWTSKGILLESNMDFESWDLWILPIDGDRKPYPIVREPGSQYRARLSPDGRWVAYAQMLERTSIPDLYVRSLSTGGKWRISTAGGSFPRWGPNGKELFYLAGDGRLMVVPIEADERALRPGAPKTLFQTGLSVMGGPGYTVSPDSQRFLIVTTDDQSPFSSIVVVSNWPAALKQ